MGTKKRGYRIGQKTIQKAKAHPAKGRSSGSLPYYSKGKGGEIGKRIFSYQAPRGIKRSLPVLTWISGDGIRRPEATSSRGRS